MPYTKYWNGTKDCLRPSRHFSHAVNSVYYHRDRILKENLPTDKNRIHKSYICLFPRIHPKSNSANRNFFPKETSPSHDTDNVWQNQDNHPSPPYHYFHESEPTLLPSIRDYLSRRRKLLCPFRQTEASLLFLLPFLVF